MQRKSAGMAGLLLLIAFTSCRSLNSYPDYPVADVKTKILAHRGGGGDSLLYPENSFAAVRYSLPSVEGVEVDLQISKDGTLWLSHEYNLPSCGNLEATCFAEATDNVIVNMDTCNGRRISFAKLETIFAYMSANHPDKFISLDIKIWPSCGLSSLGVRSIMNLMGDRIADLTEKYLMQKHVMVESGIGSFLNHVKKKTTGIECFLLATDDFKKAARIALRSGWDGISYEYKAGMNPGDIRMVRKKGLTVQLWSVDKKADLRHALSLNPDFIQTDNVAFSENLD